MAQTFPLGLDFMRSLPVMSASFDLGEAMVVSGRTAGGSVLTAGSGARLWRGNIALHPMLPAAAAAVRAKLNILREPGRSLFVRAWPCSHSAYKSGVTGVTIGSVSSNGRELRLAGLPQGFTLRAGDPISFAYGANPVRYAYHTVVTDEVVGAGGQSPLIEVTPAIRQGAVAGAAVELGMPFFKALVVPGGVSAGTAAHPFISGISFDIQQTLR